jgi:hypothetical protein
MRPFDLLAIASLATIHPARGVKHRAGNDKRYERDRSQRQGVIGVTSGWRRCSGG